MYGVRWELCCDTERALAFVGHNPETLRAVVLQRPTPTMGRDWPGSYTSVSVTGDDAYFTALGECRAALHSTPRRFPVSDKTAMPWSLEFYGDGYVRTIIGIGRYKRAGRWVAGLPELVRRGMSMFLSDPTTLKVTMGAAPLLFSLGLSD